jgi:hypothetical protein
MVMTLSVDALTNATKMLTNSLTNTSAFSNQSIEEMNGGQQLLFIFVLFVLIYFTMYLGAMIFNMSVVKIFPSVKQVSTMDFFGLYVVLHLLFC